MKILFLNGALRRKGSTEGAIDICVDHIKAKYPHADTQVVYLCEEEIVNCTSCYKCDEDGKCYIEDSVFGIVQKMLDADAIIYAFPVNAFGLSSIMQRFLERAGVGYLRFKRPLRNKLSGAIITGRRYSHEIAWAQISLNIMLNEMILVGSGFCPFIKNDGKVLGSEIIDEEGINSLIAMIDRIMNFQGTEIRTNN